MATSSHTILTPPRTSRTVLLTVILGLSFLSVVRGQSDSPCNQGRDPERDPRNPFAICLPYIGRMDDVQGPCSIQNGGGQFGNQLEPVGDVDNSGTVDFLVGHALCDSTISLRSEELLLYKGVTGGVPNSGSGQRIGPTERNSITTFVAAGDWDGDHRIDIAVNIQILGDTSEGNTEGFDITRLVIFWGNDSGGYSVADTTRLTPGSPTWQSHPMWIGYAIGTAVDLDGDGVDELVEANAGAFEAGHPQPLPNILVFRGHKGKRWGRNGIARIADSHYWNPRTPDNRGIEPTRIIELDQDDDGVFDAVFYADHGVYGAVSILYGNGTGNLPDTAAMQTVSIKSVGAGYSLFSDVTGDGIPELLTGSGVADIVKVYVGFKGQRLLEQFGSGNDSAQPGSDIWWGKPFATIWLPRKINPNWFGNDDRLFDLGDANLDGVDDIFAFSWPYVVEYNGGAKLDSMVDALINISPGTEIKILKRVGNIDGSGRDIIALTTGNEIRFYAPTKDIPSNGVTRRLPPGTGRAAVEEQSVVGDSHTVVLTAIPNPSRDEIQFSWKGISLHGSATITLYDIAGHEVSRCDVRIEDGNARCMIQGLAVGTYLAHFRCGDHSTNTTVVVQ